VRDATSRLDREQTIRRVANAGGIITRDFTRQNNYIKTSRKERRVCDGGGEMTRDTICIPICELQAIAKMKQIQDYNKFIQEATAESYSTTMTRIRINHYLTVSLLWSDRGGRLTLLIRGVEVCHCQLWVTASPAPFVARSKYRFLHQETFFPVSRLDYVLPHSEMGSRETHLYVRSHCSPTSQFVCARTSSP